MKQAREKQILAAIDYATETTTSLAEIENYERLENAIMRDFLQGSIGSKDFQICLGSLFSRPERIILYTLEELRFGLNYLNVPVGEQQQLLEHEMAHYSEAKGHKLQTRFCLTFYRTELGQLAMIPGTQVNPTLKNTLTDNERRVGLKASIVAPKELSPADLRILHEMATINQKEFSTKHYTPKV